MSARGKPSAEAGTTTRVDRCFAELKRHKRAALVTFITAGDPDIVTCRTIFEALPEAGADIIELGMPFSDPMADGPAIQASSQRALKAGQKMRATLDLVAGFRKKNDTTPIVLMGYYNPIYRFPGELFLDEAVAAGVDGLIVVDVPPEADDELCLPALARGLSFIRLATPTTDSKRLPAVLANTSGFVYYVSITGITGSAAEIRASLPPGSQTRRGNWAGSGEPYQASGGAALPAASMARSSGLEAVSLGSAKPVPPSAIARAGAKAGFSGPCSRMRS